VAPPAVSTFLVRALVEVVERTGVLRTSLFERTKLEGSRLDDIARGFELSELRALSEGAIDLTKNESLGLRIAEEASEAAFDLVAHLATHGPTLREAIALCVQFQRLLMDGAALTMREEASTATIRCDFPRTSPRADRMLSELAMAGLLRLVRGFAGAEAKLSSVSFEHARPKGPARETYARIFGDKAKWSQASTELCIPRALLERKPLHDHPELYAVLHAQAEAKLDRMERGEGIAEKVKRHLLAMPPSRIPDMNVIARELSMSERSLRRKLAEEGAVYKDLRESVLSARAALMLKDPSRSLKEIAEALGFSDAAAFQRAFKRWRGLTPGQFKQSK